MKVFISWSGQLSKEIANILHKHLPLMIQELDVFMSKHDIESGSRWSLELSKELEDSSFGISCLTHDNLVAPWILFEAGALTKHIEGRACGLLIDDLKATDVKPPLDQFQNRKFEQAEVRALINDINKKLQKPLEIERLETMFNTFWPKINIAYQKVLESGAMKTAEKQEARSEIDLLEEILTKVRNIERTSVLPSRGLLGRAYDPYRCQILFEYLDEDTKRTLISLAKSRHSALIPLNLSDCPPKQITQLMEYEFVVGDSEFGYSIAIPVQDMLKRKGLI